MNVDWGPRDPAGHRDPAFPALEEVLAPEDAVGGPVTVYYYPGRTLQAVHPVAGGALVTTDAVPISAAPPLLGEGERWDHRLRAVRRTLPLDPGLPTFAGVVRSSVLPTAELGARLLAYLPGRRAVLRLDGLVVKVGDPVTTLCNHRRQNVLWSAADRGFAMAQPLGVDPVRGVRWEELAPGVPVLRAATDHPVPPLAAGLAANLAALHRLRPPRLQLADHGAAVAVDRWRRKTVRTIGRALPDLAPRAARVVDRLAERPPDRRAPVLVHGDFHAANLLVGPTGPVLLDLDEVGLGDPELDVAVMTGRLLLVAAAGPGHPAAGPAGRLASALVAAYDECADRPLRPDVLAWYLAGTLVGRQVKTTIRHLAPGLHRLASTLLDLAEAVVDGPPAPGPELVARLAGTLAPPVPSTKEPAWSAR